MDPLNPWIDPAEVRHLAEQLLRPVTQARLTTNDLGFDEAFIGFADASRQENAYETSEPEPRQPATPSAPAQEKVFQPADPDPTPPEPEPSGQNPAPPEPPSRSRFLERVQIFRDWLAKNFGAKDIFILDREGKVIFDESGHDRLHFMARNLAIASSGPGNIHVKIGPGAILEVIPSETPYGRIVLGMLVPESLSQPHVKIIGEVLLQTASPS
ncbi:MAG: hypothetical protein NWT08_07540 [Akkermansiaceae bacterium]|jgi:hypothetical protein|nr:hypothetical protein [Akkermansiaceae bacterium]MDP4647081.1 hypothetical protein [Akkermansiaceae bacterium]MDP4897740.1 hypothetical protein [Akkermansiaceae bacterium]